MNNTQITSEIKKAKGAGKGKQLSESLSGGRGAGTLLLRINATGQAKWYARFTTEGKREYENLGAYPAVSLKGARDKAEELSKLHQSGVNVKIHKRDEEKRERAKGTFGQLIEQYINSLKDKEAVSAGGVKNRLDKHVVQAWPQMMVMPAKDITADHIEMVLAKMAQAGKTTVTNRVRSSLSACFGYGMKSERDVRRQLGNGVKYGVQFNPVSAIPVVSEWERINDKHLSEDVLLSFWDSLPDYSQVESEQWANPSSNNYVLNPVVCGFLQFLMLTGQRIDQPLRCIWRDLDWESKTLIIDNQKQKSRNKRPHVLPLTDRAIKALKLVEQWGGSHRQDGFIFCRKPLTPIAGGAVSRELKAHLSANNLPEFTPKLFRATWKTLTGKAGIDKSIRDKVQAHAQNDVSAIHYDKWEYLPEKRRCLEDWEQWLFNRGKVVQLRRVAG